MRFTEGGFLSGLSGMFGKNESREQQRPIDEIVNDFLKRAITQDQFALLIGEKRIAEVKEYFASKMSDLESRAANPFIFNQLESLMDEDNLLKKYCISKGVPFISQRQNK